MNTFGNEYFTAYVLPCYLLTPNEFAELISKYDLTKRLTFVSINIHLKKNGIWLWNSYITINESSPEKVMENVVIEAVENLQRRFSDPEYLNSLSEAMQHHPCPLT
ncbi:MAG: hypothetical protein RMI79_05005 [Nitrososphaerota archaeon]|nr:hypothetical protein [Nitrososphaerota archaeon]